MKRKTNPDLTREIVEAACRLMERLKDSEHAVFEGLPDGNRLSIEIAVLPPVDDHSMGAMRVLPDSTQGRGDRSNEVLRESGIVKDCHPLFGTGGNRALDHDA